MRRALRSCGKALRTAEIFITTCLVVKLRSCGFRYMMGWPVDSSAVEAMSLPRHSPLIRLVSAIIRSIVPESSLAIQYTKASVTMSDQSRRFPWSGLGVEIADASPANVRHVKEAVSRSPAQGLSSVPSHMNRVTTDRQTLRYCSWNRNVASLLFATSVLFARHQRGSTKRHRS
jgi:hypothetical protein